MDITPTAFTSYHIHVSNEEEHLFIVALLRSYRENGQHKAHLDFAKQLQQKLPNSPSYEEFYITWDK